MQPCNTQNANRGFALVRTASETATGNLWNESDSEAYDENGIEKVAVDKVISALEAVARRTPAKIDKYFMKEIVVPMDSRNRAWKKQLEKIVRRIRDSTVGHAGYPAIDFLEDV